MSFLNENRAAAPRGALAPGLIATLRSVMTTRIGATEPGAVVARRPSALWAIPPVRRYDNDERHDCHEPAPRT